MKTHFRTCTNPAPAFGGAQCPGESEGTQACNERPCPGDIAASSIFSFLLNVILGKR